MSIQIVPFDESLLPQAAELLARRHQRDRKALPDLPASFAEPYAAGEAIQAALKRDRARGCAALEGGRLAAYLIGDLAIDQVWGRSAWVRHAGCAYDPEAGVEPVRDLYAALGAGWVRAGVFFHFAVLPIADPAMIQAWFSLSFGIEQVHALLDLKTQSHDLPSLPDGLEICKAGPEDRERLAEMSDVIWRLQVQAPTWAPMVAEATLDTREGWASLADEADATVWLALQDGQVLGLQGYWPPDPVADNMVIPENSVYMSVAGTRPEARGRGIGTLLTRYGQAQAARAGFHYCETDWRSANLLASRFWPRQGFLPVAYRLVRRIDPRIAWANGSASL